MQNFLDFNVTMYLDALSAEYRAQGIEVTYLPFNYEADHLAVAAAGGNNEETVTIDHDSDFILCAQNSATFNNATGAGIAFPNYLARITLQTSQRNLQNALSPGVNLFGTAQRPYNYYKPLVLPAKTSFVVEVRNDDPAVVMDIRQTFTGVKAFTRPMRATAASN